MQRVQAWAERLPGWAIIMHDVLRPFVGKKDRMHVCSTRRSQRRRCGRCSNEWRERHRYLLRLLGSRALKAGGTASLRRLATCLDYNGFYS